MRLRRRKATTRLPFDAAWQVPPQLNFTRDVVERLAADQQLPALTHVDEEGIVDRRTFAELARDAARWASLLRGRLERGDRVVVVAGHVHGWHAILLGALKGGVVIAPTSETVDADELVHRVEACAARLVVADRVAEEAVELMAGRCPGTAVLYLDDAADELRRHHGRAPTEETEALEPAIVLFGPEPRGPGVVHHHASTWAASALGDQWLAVEGGDLVWIAAPTGSVELVWGGALAPWSRGAEVLAHELAFEPEERLGLIQRLGVTVLGQSADEHAQVAAVLPELPVIRTQLRRIVSFGGRLDAAVAETLAEELGLDVEESVWLPELPLLAGALAGRSVPAGALGEALSGHDLGLLADDGALLAAGVEGELAVHERPPLLFLEHLGAPTPSTPRVADGWLRTGIRAQRDEAGLLWPAGSTAPGRPREVELDRAAQVAAAAERARSAEVAERERREREDRERREAELRAEEEQARVEEEARLRAEQQEREAREAARAAEAERRRLEEAEREAAQRAEEERRRHEEAERELAARQAREAREAAEREAAERRRLEELAAAEQREREAAAARERSARERAAREEAAREAAARAEDERRREAALAAAAAQGAWTSAEEAERQRAEQVAAEERARAAAIAAEERARAERLAEEERSHAEREAAERRALEEREAAEAAQRSREERERHERAERELAKQREREAREAAKRAEEERKRIEREARAAAKRAEEERKRHEQAERELAKQREREAREAAKRAEEQRKRIEREEREAARRAQEERRRLEREAARRAEQERRQAERRGRQTSIPEPGDDVDDLPITGFADRLKHYSASAENAIPPGSTPPAAPDETEDEAVRGA